MPFGAEMNAEVAFLAKIFLNLDIPFHSLSPVYFLPEVYSFGGCFLAQNTQNVKLF